MKSLGGRFTVEWLADSLPSRSGIPPEADLECPLSLREVDRGSMKLSSLLSGLWSSWLCSQSARNSTEYECSTALLFKGSIPTGKLSSLAVDKMYRLARVIRRKLLRNFKPPSDYGELSSQAKRSQQ